MDASDLAAVIVSITSVVAVVLLVFGLMTLSRTLRSLRETVEVLRTQTLPVVAEMQSTVRQANAELERVDNLLITAESISTTVDSASRLAYLALSNPLIKAMAFAAGSARAARRFRRD